MVALPDMTKPSFHCGCARANATQKARRVRRDGGGSRCGSRGRRVRAGAAAARQRLRHQLDAGAQAEPGGQAREQPSGTHPGHGNGGLTGGARPRAQVLCDRGAARQLQLELLRGVRRSRRGRNAAPASATPQPPHLCLSARVRLAPQRAAAFATDMMHQHLVKSAGFKANDVVKALRQASRPAQSTALSCCPPHPSSSLS